MSTETVECATIQGAIDAYIEAGNSWDVPHKEISAWIVNQGLFDVPFESKLKACDRLVADALRVEVTDPQGRKARRYAAYRGPWVDGEGKERQTWLWTDATKAPAVSLHAAATEMRKGVGKDVSSLARTIASWNENNRNLRNNPIQLSWDFSEFVE